MNRTGTKQSKKCAKDFAAHIHLLGVVDFEDCESLQRRLAYDALSRSDGRICVLICEHRPLITIGRGGSRGQVSFTGAELAARQLEIRYVGRGGGCLLHGPGQLAVYPIVPLTWHGWSVGAYLERLRASLAGALAEFNIRPQSPKGGFSLYGRTGLLAAVGVAVRHGMTSHGAYLNVNPILRDYARVQAGSLGAMSSLLAERPIPVKMNSVRAALATHLSRAFACEKYHLHDGHPLLAELSPSDHDRDDNRSDFDRDIAA